MFLAAQSSIQQEIFNVGSGKTESINHLVQLLQGPVTYIPKRPGEPDCTFADIQKIRAELGWSPRVNLQEGVQILLQQIEDWREAPVWTPESIAQATKAWFDSLS